MYLISNLKNNFFAQIQKLKNIEIGIVNFLFFQSYFIDGNIIFSLKEIDEWMFYANSLITITFIYQIS